MATVTDYADRTSSAQNVTVTLTPASGDNYHFTAFGESQPTQVSSVVEWSADAGTNFFDPGAQINTGSGGGNPSQISTTTGTVANSPINIHLNNGSRWRYTTASTTGTYIISSIGVIWKT